MKSEWRVSSNIIGGDKMYIAYRLLDVNAVDHSGNREYCGGYFADRELAQKIADDLNRDEKTKLSDIKAGEQFAYGGVTWVKLDATGGATLCLVAECVCDKAFDENNCNDWRKSSLREWLNSYVGRTKNDEGFLSELIDNGADVHAFVGIVSDLTADDGMKDYGTAEDYIALLTCDLYRKYRDIIPAIEDEWYWTLTPWSCLEDYSYNVRYVISSGSLNNYNAYYGNGGVRPLCNLDSEILVLKE